MQNLKHQPQYSIHTYILLALADDIDLIRNTTIKMKETFNEFKKEAKKMVFLINENKKLCTQAAITEQ